MDTFLPGCSAVKGEIEKRMVLSFLLSTPIHAKGTMTSMVRPSCTASYTYHQRQSSKSPNGLHAESEKFQAPRSGHVAQTTSSYARGIRLSTMAKCVVWEVGSYVAAYVEDPPAMEGEAQCFPPKSLAASANDAKLKEG